MTGKNLVIVCYSFPPRPGVGGRKWAKYTKYLKALGWNISVIMARPGKRDISPWDKDSAGVKKIFLPAAYPDILNETPANIWQKIWYRICLFTMKALTRSNYYDRGVFWKKKFLLETKKELLRTGSTTLAVTGGPFSLLYYGAVLKRQMPHITYVADIRDDWTSDIYYGFGSLSPGRKAEERRRLQFVLETADAVLVPNTDLEEKYTELEQKSMDKIVVIPHLVDTEFLVGRSRDFRARPLQVKYFGSLYQGCEKSLELLAQYIKGHPEEIGMEIFSSEKKYAGIFEKHGVMHSGVHYHPPVEESVVFSLMAQSSVVVMFVTEKFKDFVPTKLMEILATRTPILALGKAGKVSEFLETNRLGIFLNPDSNPDYEEFTTKLDTLNYNHNFDYSEFTFPRQMEKLEKIFMQKPTNI